MNYCCHIKSSDGRIACGFSNSGLCMISGISFLLAFTVIIKLYISDGSDTKSQWRHHFPTICPEQRKSLPNVHG